MTENRMTFISLSKDYGSIVGKWENKWCVYHSGVVIAVCDTEEEAQDFMDKVIRIK